MSGHEANPESGETFHWPVILLPPDDDGLVRGLEEKAVDYERYIFEHTDNPHVPLILMAEYHDRNRDRGDFDFPAGERAEPYAKTATLLEWIVLDEVLQRGSCDTADLNRRLHEDAPYIHYFVAIQGRDMVTFDSLVQRAATVIAGHVSGEIPVRLRSRLSAPEKDSQQ